MMQKSQKTKIHSWVQSFQYGKELLKKSPRGFVFYLGQADSNKYSSLVKEHALSWQFDALQKNEKEVVYFTGQTGPVWIVRAKSKSLQVQHEGLLEDSEYSWSRDQVGALVAHFKVHQLKAVQIEFRGTSEEQELGALTGLELAAYNFKAQSEAQPLADLPEVSLKKSLGTFDKALLKKASQRGQAVNWARHLVNLPPNELNPQSFSQLVSQVLPKNIKVQVWNTLRLQKEKMGLHLAVGQGAKHGACMVHISYRPRKKSKKQPLAFVGKGITFDTGGLDIKPSSGMRLMKKDMGGAAAVFATALWVAESQYPHPCDFYLALAENSIDANAFRPSDVITARNGLKVEIDNTDAEGRLVLADVLDVAVTQKKQDEPALVIDVATLTGAIKVGLGADVAGLFTNDDGLAHELTTAGQKAGDLNWRMPLVEKYFSSMSSQFADFKNSGEGFGGAITAALFLQKFIKGKKWAHLDVYAWTDKGQGPLSAGSGNGQPVQCLIQFLENRI